MNKSFNSIAKPQQQTIRSLLSYLKNPHKDMKFIHIAGTNGKGSVCAYLQSILTAAGYKTGKYTSPHMICERERISVNGENIPEEIFSEIIGQVICAAKKIKDTPTQFELWTAAAFCYFKMQNCDYVVLETGLGGTKDATNVIENPVMCIITQIALDHTDLLGKTLIAIAKEKAGIIKKSIYKCNTVTVEQDKEVLNVLETTAKEHNHGFLVVKPPSISELTDNCEIFSYGGIENIKIQMLGDYQKENAALSIDAAKLLGICEKDILSGIYNAKNPGRFEILKTSPTIIFDGAHNTNGMKGLCNSLKSYFPKNNFCFIFGAMRDKDTLGTISVLKEYGFSDNSLFLTVTVSNNSRAEKSEVLCKLFKSEGFNTVDSQNMKNALKLIPCDDTITVICGSLYLYEEFFSSQD